MDFEISDSCTYYEKPIMFETFWWWHIFKEGNWIADFLARNGEDGKTHTYMQFNEMPKEVRGMLCLDKLGLPTWHF